MLPITDQKKYIQALPEFLINQIKAGEVIERPASLLKELIENAIDAGSTIIDIQIQNNGLDFLQIKDNGHGISWDQLPLAFARHATSKIKKYEDIYNLYSYGFRGEALASISSIARVTCYSTPKESPEKGGKIIIYGGKINQHLNSQGLEPGTSISIEDLFYNTPVRLKFIKSNISEKNALKRVINSYLLTNPSIAFSIKWDEKDKEIYPSIESQNFQEAILKRALKILKIKDQDRDGIISFEGEYQDHSLKGLIAIQGAKSAHHNQFLFVNGRPFFDKTIHQTIKRATEKWVHQGASQGSSQGSWPYVISIKVPPKYLDANVHPAKTEVKFQYSSYIFSLCYSAIHSTLEKHFKNQAPATGNMEQTPLNTHARTHQHQADIAFGDEGHTLIPLTEGYALTKFENHFQLIHIKKFIAHYILYHLKKIYPAPADELTPLLISEPILLDKAMPSHDFNKATFFLTHKLGFETEVIDAETLVVRSIPSILKDFHPKLYINNILTFFINFYKNNRGENLTIDKFWEFLIQDFEPNLNYLAMNRLAPLTTSFREKVSPDIAFQFTREIKQNHLDSLFHHHEQN